MSIEQRVDTRTIPVSGAHKISGLTLNSSHSFGFGHEAGTVIKSINQKSLNIFLSIGVFSF